MQGLAKLFLGEDRKLRFFWRAFIFFVLAEFVLIIPLDYLSYNVWQALHLPDGLTAANTALGESGNFFTALIMTAIFAFYEKRSLFAYGFPWRGALGLYTSEGLIAGTLMAAFVAFCMYFMGGMHINGYALSGNALVIAALAWFGAMIVVGVAEESLFRSYFLVALWRSIGFWPASLIIAAIFAALHYFFKAGENIWDVITLVTLSLALCLSFRRSGTLWFAVGFHVAFDYMQFFVIGTPNGEQVPVDHLLNTTFTGPAWITGGVLGTEASFFMYPAIALLWLYIWLRFTPEKLPEAVA